VSYLPPNPTEATSFPIAYGKDIALAIRMIEEKWTRHFPELAYYQLKKATDPASPDPDSPTGEAGNTIFDPVWGEAIPAAMSSEWQQPHANDIPDAPRPELYADPVNLHLRVFREARDMDLKRWGFDKVRDLLIASPLSLLDKVEPDGVTVRVGDYFIWDGDEYEVMQYSRDGYWKNTNVRLYIVMNCKTRRKGS
jgi:hypothetical protein